MQVCGASTWPGGGSHLHYFDNLLHAALFALPRGKIDYSEILYITTLPHQRGHFFSHKMPRVSAFLASKVTHFCLVVVAPLLCSSHQIKYCLTLASEISK